MALCRDERARETHITVNGDMDADWNTLANKPPTFPSMHHDHAMSDIDGLDAWASALQEDIPTKTSELENDAGFMTSVYVPEQVNSDWNSTAGYSMILNKPTLFSGVYDDLVNKPVLFDGSYDSLMNKPALFSGIYADLVSKPVLSPVALSNDYNDLTNKPTIPVLPTYSTVASTGNYNDLINKPTIPTVNYPVVSVNGKLGSVVLLHTDVGAAPVTHTHSIADVVGLQAALDAKQSTSSVKRQETYSGVTNASGVYSVTFATPYPVAPNLQAQINGGTMSHFFRTTVSTTGFTVTVGTRAAVTVLGLEVLLAATVVSPSVAVDVLITSK